MSKLEDNKRLLKLLSDRIEKYPDLRFIQALWSLRIIDKKDRFYEESSETLERILI